MDKNLETYVKIYDNWLDDDICNKTISELQNANWEKHTYTNAGESIGRSVNGEREFDITNNCMSSISSREVIMQRIWDAYQKYLIDFNFKWFGTWSGFTEVRFNRYTVDTLMSLHCDHININSDVPGGKGFPTMTALGLLNDDYDGGEFEMFEIGRAHV